LEKAERRKQQPRERKQVLKAQADCENQVLTCPAIYPTLPTGFGREKEAARKHQHKERNIKMDTWQRAGKDLSFECSSLKHILGTQAATANQQIWRVGEAA
jgi:hypothetical protein